MPQLTVGLGYNVRNYHRRIQNFSILTNLTTHNYDKFSNGLTARDPKTSVNSPDWEFSPTVGLNGYFKKHNDFRDQELHNRLSRGYVLRQGTQVKYYTTTFNPQNDPLYHEDGARTVDRVFDIPIILSFQPQSELYAKFGIQALDESECFIHMGLFLELNYQNLRKMAIDPACNPLEHNPIVFQRGYEEFRFYGYTAEQIFPKSGDKMKMEAFNILYNVENINDNNPQYQHRWRKYWWKASIKAAVDDGSSISPDVLEDPEQQGFINDILGIQDGKTLDKNGNPIEYPFDVSKAVDELKKDVLFKAPEVDPNTTDISADPNWYPGYDKGIGGW